MLDEAYIAVTAAKVNEAIDSAAVGAGTWDGVAQVFADAFPGTYVAINNLDLVNNRTNFEVAHNFDPEFRRSFYEHYVYINPWLDIWNSVPSGTVLIAERHCPARQFRGTEFYEDWVVPQEDIEGSTGLMIDAGPNDRVLVPIHYPLRYADKYDVATAGVLEGIRGNLERAIRLARRIGDTSARVAASSAIVGRFSEAALVVGYDMQIREGNDIAERELLSGRFLRGIAGKLTLADADANARLRLTVRKLADGGMVDNSRFDVAHAGCAWRVTFNRLPRLADHIAQPAPQNLVTVRNLTERKSAADLTAFGRLYGLTTAEIGMCELIANGHSVADIADILEIARGTARQRLKSIFLKTGTHRQAQLVGLISSFS